MGSAMRHLACLAVVIAGVALSARPAAADDWTDCLQDGNFTLKLLGCGKTIDAAGNDAERKARAYNERGYAYFTGKQYDRAVADFDQAIRLSPRAASIYYNRCNALIEQAQFDRAAADCGKAVELDPGFGEARQALKEATDRKAAVLAKAETDRRNKLEADRVAALEAARRAKEEADRAVTAEAARKAEAERLVRLEAERKAKDEADRLAKLEAERKAEADRLAKLEADRKAKEQTDRLAALKVEQDRQARIVGEQRAKEAKDAADRKAEADRLAAVEAARKAKEEADRLAALKAEQDRLAKLEAERKAKEEADRLAALKVEQDRQARLVAEQRAKDAKDTADRKAEVDRLAVLEAARKAKEEADRLAKLEADRKAEADRLARLEAARKAQEEADRLAKLEGDRKAEVDRLAKLETERKAKEEADRLAALEAERTARDAQQLLALRTPSPARPAAGRPTVPEKLGRRVALVIGNSAYSAAPRLASPARDAAAIADAFRSLGFSTVRVRTDLGLTELLAAIDDFARLSENSDWAVVYYAGHGRELDGTNYALPIDARLARPGHLALEAVRLEQLMYATAAARGLRLVIFDACRDSSCGTVAANGVAPVAPAGIAPINAPGGVLVAYAARPGQPAVDDGGASVFATALLENLQTPDLELAALFRRVADSVRRRTGNRQEPLILGQIGAEQHVFRPTIP